MNLDAGNNLLSYPPFYLSSLNRFDLKRTWNHLMIIDFKAVRHFISKIHVTYFIMELKHANNECYTNIMYSCFVYFHNTF